MMNGNPSRVNIKQLSGRINLHTIRDDSLLGTLKFVSKTKDCQKYGALIPDGMINDDIKFYTAYKTYLDYAIGKVPPKKARKFKKAASPKLKTVPASPKEPSQKGSELKDLPKRPLLSQQPVLSSEILLMSAEEKLRKSKQETHKLQASGSSEGVDFESEVPDKPIGKTKETSDSKDESDDVYDEENNDDDDGNDDDSGNDDDGGNDAQDSEQANLDDDENPSFTLKDYEEEEQD
nr:hypothetical protein [Tanacetum cinerariifolium]